MHPPICTRVIHLSPPTRAARLEGFWRFKVDGAPYPGIRKTALADSTVHGLLLYLPNESYYKLLDLYEGGEYERRTVMVDLVGDDLHPERVECDVYVFVSESGETKEEWSLAAFISEMESLGF